MKEIELTQGLFAAVDDEDFTYLMQWNWFTLKPENKFYAARDERDNKTILMHRVIVNMSDDDDREVKHLDGNGLNNTRGNLLILTHAQIRQNADKRSDNTSGYKGVFWRKDNNKWMAQIGYENKNIYLGMFVDKIEAARAYDAAAKKCFGEFAKLNFPIADHDDNP